MLRGRIDDAVFSFEKDKNMGLEAMAAQLGKVVFHVKAGSIKDKTERLVTLAGYLADTTGAPGAARERALEAARLAKADQVSIMVREFADLEGVMGETYALMEGRDPEVAQAIREQFLREGDLEQVSEDHSWVGEMVRRGDLSAARQQIHPHRNVITRVLGTDGEIQPDVVEKPVFAGDRVLLCSDGLTGMLADTEILELLAGGRARRRRPRCS